MAGFPPSKSVQELAANKELPQSYVCKSAGAGAASLMIPVIDLALLAASSSEQLEKLRSALTTFGCFQVVNHGITDAQLDKVRQVSKQFFALPMNEKKKYSRQGNDIEGYGNDVIHYDEQILDWNDRLYLKVNPQNQRRIRFWPETPQEFREVLDDYTMKSQLITQVLLKAMARTLNLEEKCFSEQYGEQAHAVMYVRFNCYPPCPRPDLVLGLKPHADGTAITIVLQDKEVEGLQFLKNNQWVRVPIIPHALVINIGDQIEIMSNGVYKSPVHRVVTDSQRERFSLAMFCCPGFDNKIKVVDQLIDEKRPRMYKNVKNYVETFFEWYQQGKRPMDALRL